MQTELDDAVEVERSEETMVVVLEGVDRDCPDRNVAEEAGNVEVAVLALAY